MSEAALRQRLAVDVRAGETPWLAGILAEWADPALAVVAGLWAMMLYLLTLAPTVTAGDSGELITAAYELGVPHPPGYPLWCLLAHAVIVLFEGLGEVAQRVNVFSAVCGASACGLIFLAGRGLGLGRAASFAAATALACSRELWAQSVVAEVYSLNAAIFGACLLCLIRWDQYRRRRWLLALAGLMGLGMADHHTVGIMGPPALLWVLLRDWRTLRDWRLIVGVIVLFVLPLTLYLYLPWASGRGPYMDWGHPATLGKAWEHVTRAQYRENYAPQARSVMALLFQLGLAARDFLEQFSPAGGIALLVGAPALWRRGVDARHRAVAGLAGGIALSFAWMLNTKFERQEVEANRVFFVPAYMAAALVGGCLLEQALQAIRVRLARRRATIRRAALGLVVLLPATLGVLHNYRANDLSGYWYAVDHGRNLLNTLEPGGVILPSGDHNTFPLIYLHRILGHRPDVCIADKYGYIEARDFPMLEESEPGSGRVARSHVLGYLLSRTDVPVYFTVKTALPAGLNEVRQAQVGLLFRVARSDVPSRMKDIWNRYRYRNEGVAPDGDYGAVSIVADWLYFQGLQHMGSGQVREGLARFRECLELSQGIKEVYNNVASALAEAGLVEQAIGHYRQALRYDGQYLNALWNLARSYSSTDRPEQAAAYYQTIRSLRPDDHRAAGELGLLSLRRLGQTREAMGHLRDSLAMNPSQPQLLDALKEVESELERQEMDRRFALDRQEHDFGRVILGQTAKHDFTLTNDTHEILDLGELRPDCGCLSAQVANTKLAPGDKTTVSVALNEGKRLGPLEKTVTLRTTSGLVREIRLTAAIVNRREVVGEALTVSDALPGVQQSRDLVVVANDGQPFTIQSVASTLGELEVAFDSAALAATRHTLRATVTPGLSAGVREGLARVRMSEGQSLEIPVRLAVIPAATVTPKSLFLGGLSRRQKIERAVSVELPGGWKAGVKAVTPSAPWIHVIEPPALLEGKTVLRLQMDPSRMPTPFSGSVVVQTDHPAIPHIVIPVYGYTEE